MAVHNGMGIWLFTLAQFYSFGKSFFTKGAPEWFFTHMGLLMLVQFCSLDEFLFTKGAA